MKSETVQSDEGTQTFKKEINQKQQSVKFDF